MDKKVSEKIDLKFMKGSYTIHKNRDCSVILRISNYGQNLSANITSSSSYEDVLEIVVIKTHQQPHN